MSVVSGVVVFFMIWWTVLFAVLPWGNRPSQDVVLGNVASAPDKPRLLKKFLATTAISCILWGVVYALISYRIISFYDMAAEMAEQDKINYPSEQTNQNLKDGVTQ